MSTSTHSFSPPYVLALVGFNRQQTEAAMRLIVDHNDCIYPKRAGMIKLPDGTLIKPIFDSSYIDGCHPDQIILADDKRFLVKQEKADMIGFLLTRTTGRVPPDFELIYYCMD